MIFHKQFVKLTCMTTWARAPHPAKRFCFSLYMEWLPAFAALSYQGVLLLCIRRNLSMEHDINERQEEHSTCGM